jgi:hypothetical protein
VGKRSGDRHAGDHLVAASAADLPQCQTPTNHISAVDQRGRQALAAQDLHEAKSGELACSEAPRGQQTCQTQADTWGMDQHGGGRCGQAACPVRQDQHQASSLGTETEQRHRLGGGLGSGDAQGQWRPPRRSQGV